MAEEKELLQTVLSEALEGFALLFLEMPQEGDAVNPDNSYRRSTLVMRHGSDKIRMMIVAAENLCREMAANVTGSEEDEISTDLLADALSELCNITAGSWSAARFGEADVCVLESPESAAISVDEIEALRADDALSFFMVEGRPVLIGLFFE